MKSLRFYRASMCWLNNHYSDVIMGAIASQITSLTIVSSTVYSGADQRKHQSSASLAFVWGIHRGPVNSPHKWPVTRKMFPFDDVIMRFLVLGYYTGYDLHGKYMVEYTLTVGLWFFQRSSPMTQGWITCSRADVWKQVPRYAPFPMLLCGWKKTLFRNGRICGRLLANGVLMT